MTHTPGPWKKGKHLSEVITNNDNALAYLPPGARDEEAIRYYGGYLVAESVYGIGDSDLIAAAPELLYVVEEALKFHDDQIHDIAVWDKAREALKKAKGESS